MSICAKYRAEVDRRSKRKIPSPECPRTDRRTKNAEIELTITQDDGQNVEVKDKKERKKKKRDAEEIAARQVQDTPSECSAFPVLNKGLPKCVV